eukprot:TRINITY_DN10170_c0_g1_i1.p1 TRINITY_DN10170_c0_g1~~TRINITY_DN10170_c0_g1_i1.p1  ORF type:complete len:1458 (+),score=309.36 TRINITY_DN10170_c0_g1_i1:148-4374(+)
MAQGGYTGNEIFACYCSKYNKLIFWYIRESGAPLIRFLPWFEEAGSNISSMSFDFLGQWIICVTEDLTIALIPIFFMMLNSNAKKNNTELNYEPPKWNVVSNTFIKNERDLNQITYLNVAKKNKATKVTDSIWWRTKAGEDFGIISSVSGYLRIINFSTNEMRKVKISNSVRKMEHIEDSNKTYKYLLLHCQGGVYLKLLLEYEGEQYENIFYPSRRAQMSGLFLPIKFKCFPQGTRICKQSIQKSGVETTFLGVFHPSTYIYELYDPLISHDTRSYPTYSYQLIEGSIRYIQITENCIYLILSDSADTSCKLVILSKYLSSFSGHINNRLNSQILLQEIPIPIERKKIHILEQNPHIEGDLLNQTKGFFFWSDDSLYQVSAKVPPENVFFSLLAKGDFKMADPFGATFGLDLLLFYEIAADTFFEDHDMHMKAHDLYFLSNVKESSFVKKYLEIEKIDLIISRLRNIINSSSGRSLSERENISSILLQCYTYKLLISSNDKPLMLEFEQYLWKNEYYDAQKGINLLMESKLFYFVLVIGEARKMVDHSMYILSQGRGSFVINQQDIEFFKENYLTEELKEGASGFFIRSLPPKLQVQLYIEDIVSVHKYLQKISSLLPELDINLLNTLAAYFDPFGENMVKTLVNIGSTNIGGDSIPIRNDSEKKVREEEFIELFMEILIILNYKKSASRRRRVLSFSREISKYETKSQISQTIRIKKISAGMNHVLAISDNGEVYSWGKNNFGQLGLGHNETMYNPEKVEYLSGVYIVDIACGGEHSLALDDNNNLWSWGNGEQGQLGNGKSSKIVPTKVIQFEETHVIKILAGYNFSVVFTGIGIYTFGDGSCGQLGLGDTSTREYPTKIVGIDGLRVEDISCGHSHVVLLCRNGELWTWGNGSSGQLGHGDTDDRLVPTMVEYLLGKHIKSVDCGSYHTIAITDIENIYTWGSGNKSPDPSDSNYMFPSIVNSLRGTHLTHIYCGNTHNIGLTGNGDMYIWNSNSENNSKNINHQKPMNQKMTIITAWSDSDSESTISSSPTVQLSQSTPSIVSSMNDKNIEDVSCGNDFTLFLDDNGSVYSWGSGKFGKLGHGETCDKMRPEKITSLKTVISYNRISSSNYWDSTPKKNSKNVRYNQDMLLTTVRELEKSFRPNIILEKANQWGNWEAAAIILEEIGNWSSSVSSRLLQIDANTDNPEQKEKALIRLFEYITTCLFVDEEIEDKEIIILKILKYWSENELSHSLLSQFILDNIELLGPDLGILLENSDDAYPLCVDFPSEIYLQITKVYLRTMEENFNSSQRKKDIISDSNYWENIMANITNKLHQNRYIKLDVQFISDEEGDNLVFTCGHIYSGPEFDNYIYPQFQHKMNRIAYPVTSELLQLNFLQKFVSSACPKCVYKSISSSKDEEWEI